MLLKILFLIMIIVLIDNTIFLSELFHDYITKHGYAAPDGSAILMLFRIHHNKRKKV